jgi:hypothetical protein
MRALVQLQRTGPMGQRRSQQEPLDDVLVHGFGEAAAASTAAPLRAPWILASGSEPASGTA